MHIQQNTPDNPYDITVTLGWPDLERIRSSPDGFACERRMFAEAMVWVRGDRFYEGSNGWHPDLLDERVREHARVLGNSDVEVMIPKAVLDCSLIRAVNVHYRRFEPQEFEQEFMEKYGNSRVRVVFP